MPECFSACPTGLLGQHVKCGCVDADLCSDGTSSGSICPQAAQGQDTGCPALPADAVCYAGGEPLVTIFLSSPVTCKVLYSLLLAFTQHAHCVEMVVLDGAAFKFTIVCQNHRISEPQTIFDPILLLSPLRTQPPDSLVPIPTPQADINSPKRCSLYCLCPLPSGRPSSLGPRNSTLPQPTLQVRSPPNLACFYVPNEQSHHVDSPQETSFALSLQKINVVHVQLVTATVWILALLCR